MTTLQLVNAVKIKYNNPTIEKNKNILSIDNFEIDTNTNITSNFKFSGNDKVLGIEYVTQYSDVVDSIVSIDTIESTQQSIKLQITNGNAFKMKISFNVYGIVVNSNEASIEKVVDGTPTDIIKYLEIDASMIQNDAYAETYRDVILKYLSTDVSFIEIKTKGNPLLRVGDIVNLNCGWLDFNGLCIVSNINFSVGVSCTCSIVLLNTAALQ